MYPSINFIKYYILISSDHNIIQQQLYYSLKIKNNKTKPIDMSCIKI